jgi:hypothetical protein
VKKTTIISDAVFVLKHPRFVKFQPATHMTIRKSHLSSELKWLWDYISTSMAVTGQLSTISLTSSFSELTIFPVATAQPSSLN